MTNIGNRYKRVPLGSLPLDEAYELVEDTSDEVDTETPCPHTYVTISDGFMYSEITCITCGDGWLA